MGFKEKSILRRGSWKEVSRRFLERAVGEYDPLGVCHRWLRASLKRVCVCIKVRHLCGQGHSSAQLCSHLRSHNAVTPGLGAPRTLRWRCDSIAIAIFTAMGTVASDFISKRGGRSPAVSTSRPRATFWRGLLSGASVCYVAQLCLGG